MDIKQQFTHVWKAYFKRGEGEAFVYGENEAQAKKAALAYYRSKKTLVDFTSIEDIVAHVDYIGKETRNA